MLLYYPTTTAISFKILIHFSSSNMAAPGTDSAEVFLLKAPTNDDAYVSELRAAGFAKVTLVSYYSRNRLKHNWNLSKNFF